MSFSMPSQMARWGAALLLLALLAGCDSKQAPPAGKPPGGGMPPAQVGVVTVTPREVPLTAELPGRLEASRVAQVRARAAGILQKRLFREGSDVKAGQLLFQIDAAPYQASAGQRAGHIGARPGQPDAGRGAGQRFKPLLEANAISKQEYVNAVAAQQAGRGRCRRGEGGGADGADQPGLCHASPRRSAGASAARWSPKARWSARARPRNWR